MSFTLRLVPTQSKIKIQNDSKPKEEFSKVIKDLNNTFYPICGTLCLYRTYLLDGKLQSQPVLRRHTHNICSVCNIHSTSLYEMKTCPRCATDNEYPDEFLYYHKFCPK